VPTSRQSDVALRRILEWYFERVYGRLEGVGTVPFYCDQVKVGGFAVAPRRLASGTDDALFQLLVGIGMFQAQRDVVVMKRQRSIAASSLEDLISARRLRVFATEHGCSSLSSPESLEQGCSVFKRNAQVDCVEHPGEECHVKRATVAFNRMGDMGKLPTSAWQRLWKDGTLRSMLRSLRSRRLSPYERADALVDLISAVHRVGRKLATLFVSALSTPALAPGLAPWFPEIDGNNLVVVDTNVRRAVRALSARSVGGSYDAAVAWVRGQARKLDLRIYSSDVPAYSPRVLQQAIYCFASGSNRRSAEDPCSCAAKACHLCVEGVCPFGTPPVRGVRTSPTPS
jgi:hypothetical protein